MRKFLLLLFASWLLIGTSLAAQSAPSTRSDVVVQPHLEAQLLAEHQQVTPGDTVVIAVKLMPEAGWHTYWLNPGDSGLATVIHWDLPNSGFIAEDIQWPIAQKFNIGHLSNYGFEGDTYLLSTIHIPSDYAETTVPINAAVDWLVCEEICIPGTATFSVELAVGDSVLAAENRAEFALARANLPELASWPAYFDIQAQQVTILVDHPSGAAMADGSLYAFVGAGELVEHQPAGSINAIDNQLLIQRQLNTYFHDMPRAFELLLVNDERAVQITVAASEQGPAGNVETDATSASLAWVLLLAMAGGLLLNLMPCVFPVLSLKALHLANQNNSARADAIGYTLGVIITFVAIAGLLILLRAGGQALGWGFQLQNPLLIALLALLFIAIALNLLGVYQIGTRLMSLGQSGHQQNSFATGVLAVVIASPCTAPFMGVALGFAIIQPPSIALLIFAALGFGMALPFLLLGFVPQVARLLPKPGAWMETFKHWMALPMNLTTVWLLWVFGRQAGVDSLALLLIAAVLFATALWCFGSGQLKPAKRARQHVLGWLLLALCAVSLYFALQMQQASHATSNSQQNWQSWNPSVHDELQTKQPVFVNMTADWCITCLANERVALETEATRALFANHNIAYLKGDWTLQNPEITEYLGRYQRNGVPLYVLYWPGKEAQVLPQILTPALLREVVLNASQ